MNKKECKIIQDLLPNYIESLTTKETNEFIDNHLVECKECKKTLDAMKKNTVNEQKSAKKQIDYLKKYRRKMIYLKVLIAFVVVFVLIFFGVRFYQLKIISKIFDHNIDYNIGNNYKLIQRDGRTGAITEMLYKDGISYLKLNDKGDFWENENTKYMIIEDENKYLILDKKSPPLGLDSRISFGTYGLFNTEKKSDLLKLILTKGIDIHEEEYGDYQCYVINFEGEKIWVDKETMFIIRNDYAGQTTEYKVETNIVMENDVKLPNLENYTKIN